MRPIIRLHQSPETRDLPLPERATGGAAGLDLRAAAPPEHPIVIEPGKWALVPTGLRAEIPPGHEGQVRPRSGLAFRHGVTVLNAPGTIDEDYRGEIGVILINHGPAPFEIRRGDRIAQLVVCPVAAPEVVAEDAASGLGATARGEGGFGHTGGR